VAPHKARRINWYVARECRLEPDHLTVDTCAPRLSSLKRDRNLGRSFMCGGSQRVFCYGAQRSPVLEAQLPQRRRLFDETQKSCWRVESLNAPSRAKVHKSRFTHSGRLLSWGVHDPWPLAKSQTVLLAGHLAGGTYVKSTRLTVGWSGAKIGLSKWPRTPVYRWAVARPGAQASPLCNRLKKRHGVQKGAQA